MCSSLPSVRVAVPPSLLRRYSALPHTVALHVVALLIAVVVVAPILIGSLRGCRRIVPRTSLHSARRRLCAPPLIVVPSLLSGAVYLAPATEVSETGEFSGIGETIFSWRWPSP